MFATLLADKEIDGARRVRGTSARPVLNIHGEKIALGPLTRENTAIYQRWLNDLDTLRRGGFPVKPVSAERMVAAVERWMNTEDMIWFMVYELATLLPVGFAGISHVDLVNRKAEFNICIGEGSARSKGYGTEAARLVLDYAFTALGLHSVYLVTSELNIPGQRAYAKAGFKEFGRQRQATMEGGHLWDLIHMECLSHEFHSPVLVEQFGLHTEGLRDIPDTR